MIFGALWTTNTIIAVTIFIIAAACSVWYYARVPGVEIDHPVCSGIHMSLRYHFGSLAFGALIMSFLQVLQFIFEALHTQMNPDD